MEDRCKEKSLEIKPHKAWDHLTLKYNDSGKLMRLIATLFDRFSVNLIQKLNLYFQEETRSDLSFIIEHHNITKELFISVLGGNILQEKIIVKDWDDLPKTPTALKAQDLPLVLKGILDEELINADLKVTDIIHVIPITLPQNQKRNVLTVVLVNPEPSDDFVEWNIGLVKECMRYCVPGIISVLAYEEEKLHHVTCKSLLNVLYKVIDKIGHVESLLDRIEKESCNALHGEKAYIYIVERNHLVTTVLNFGSPIEIQRENLGNVRLPLGVGLSGIAAETGQVINCSDPLNDKRYSNILDRESRLTVRNLIVFPLVYREKVIGVIEVYNKLHVNQFTKSDEELCVPLGILYGALINQSFLFSKLVGSLNRDAEVNEILLSRMMLENDSMVDTIVTCKDHDFDDVSSYNYDVYALDENHTVCLVLHVFTKLGFLRKYNINDKTFVRFVLRVKEGCMKVPFHNWRHTLATFHFMSCLINNLDLIKNEFITVIEGMALMLAALCHDLDYRGPTTPFQVTTGTVLGSLYSSPGSVAQFFQGSQALRLLSIEGCNILTNFSNDQYLVTVKMVMKMIVYTNLAEHICKRERIAEMIDEFYNNESVEHRQLLHSLLMTCCDLSDYTKPWSHCRSIAEATFYEFFREGDLQYAQGVFKMSDMRREFQRIPDLQSNFIETICLPAFTQLSQLFPVTQVFVANVQQNLEDFGKCKEEFERRAEEQFLEPEVPTNEEENEYDY